jgi:nifR3 family TIM-barrel protein
MVVQGSVIMAPMAGVGGSAFRQVAREFGASLVVTPLINATALVHGDQKSLRMAKPRPVEEPCAVQLFGSNEQVMKRAARLVADHGATIIDLNFGCPARRIVAEGSGARLLLNQELLSAIAAAVVDAVDIPVTAKIRAGWSRQHVVAKETAQAVERAGVAAVTIHARTKTDAPACQPNWMWIRDAVQSVSIPVIGNGGVASPEDAVSLVKTTGCAAVMIGRAAVGRPWLLGQCQRALDGEAYRQEPDWHQRLSVARRHVTIQAGIDPEKHDVKVTAGLISAYMRGMHGARAIRPQLFKQKTYCDLVRIIDSVIEQHGPRSALPTPETGSG